MAIKNLKILHQPMKVYGNNVKIIEKSFKTKWKL
jgi:hypothetical protein